MSVNAEPKRKKASKGSEAWVLFRYTDAEQTVGEVHGVYSSAERAEAAANEWLGRDCSLRMDELSIDSWTVDD